MGEYEVKGKYVYYNGKRYIVMHQYDSGYCELKEEFAWRFKLVHVSELKE
jgi:hypothetical protein